MPTLEQEPEPLPHPEPVAVVASAASDDRVDSAAWASEQDRIARSLPPEFPKADSIMNQSFAAAGKVDKPAKLEMQLPPDVVKNNDFPDDPQVHKVGDVTVRKWPHSGHQHWQYPNGAEVLLDKSGRVVSQLESRDSQGQEGWERSQFTYEYSKVPGQENKVSKMTAVDPRNGVEHFKREVGRDCVLSIDPSNEMANPGYSYAHKQKLSPGEDGKPRWHETKQTNNLDLKICEERKTYNDGKLEPGSEMTMTTEILQEERPAPDGNGKLPKGTWLQTGKYGDNSWVQAHFPKSHECESATYTDLEGGKMQKIGETWHQPRTVVYRGNFPVATDLEGLVPTKDGYAARNISGWQKNADGSMNLIRRDPDNIGLRKHAMTVVQDQNKQVIGIDIYRGPRPPIR